VTPPTTCLRHVLMWNGDLFFALSRFGGLRRPSEHLAVTWDGIDRENDRIRIKSPKAEHHAGKISRTIPIFPELRPHLGASFDQAAEGGVHVITRYRKTSANLRRSLTRILECAGLKPWPKLFQNFRSRRETELVVQFPIHVVCSWIGNTKAVAVKHYLQTTEEHFRKATQNPTQTVHDNGDCDGLVHQETPRKSLSDTAGQLVTCRKVVSLELHSLWRLAFVVVASNAYLTRCLRRAVVGPAGNM